MSTAATYQEIQTSISSGTIFSLPRKKLEQFVAALSMAQAYTHFGRSEFPSVCETARLALSMKAADEVNSKIGPHSQDVAGAPVTPADVASHVHFTFKSIPDFAVKLTSVQKTLIDTIWARLVQCGKPTPKRSLPGIIGKIPIAEVFKGLGREFVFETTENGDACYSLTSYGAFLSGQGIEIALLLARLLDLVKDLYAGDSYLKMIDKDQVQKSLGTSDAETKLLFTLLQIRLPPRFPFYLGSCNPDGSVWTVSITDDVIELYGAADTMTYFDALLAAGFRIDEPKILDIIPLPFHQSIGQAHAEVTAPYLSQARLDEMKTFKNQKFDCTRLVCLCEELNSCASNGNVHAVIMLTRAILDHVPPIFGHTTFIQVSSNYGGGGSSFKKSIERLENQAKKVADRLLHMPIRDKEIAPNMNEVTFAQELETLLAEVCRLLKPAP